ncbi:MAG TPA: hypothetical protein VLG37_00005 [Candidatus Saccharimonadales bacterium]|nr:hypothetical protein [Candidatus Saccharimonadales bacterium]
MSETMPEALPIVPEPEAIPSVMELYGDRVFTIMGVTGTLNNLKRFCPEDLGQVETQKIEDWATKHLTEAGFDPRAPENVREALAAKKK